MGNLNNSKILIGRSTDGNRLQVAVYKSGKRVYATLQRCVNVPGSVSRLDMVNERAHCSLEIDGSGKMRLFNLKSLNQTYVDGMQVQERSVTPLSRVQLGMDGYPLDLQSVLFEAEQLASKIVSTLPKASGYGEMPGGVSQGNVTRVDIRHLEYVWEEYEAETEAIMKRRKNLGILASITPIFTIGGAAVAGCANYLDIGKEATACMWIFSAVALLFFMVVLYLRLTDKSDVLSKQARERFLKSYHCPKCHKFVGNLPYFLIREMKKCPGCGSEFIS